MKREYMAQISRNRVCQPSGWQTESEDIIANKLLKQVQNVQYQVLMKVREKSIPAAVEKKMKMRQQTVEFKLTSSLVDDENLPVFLQSIRDKLQTSPELKIHLDLSQNELSSQSCRFLARSGLSSLVKLSLERNYIRAPGCKYLGFQNIQSLNISWNCIGNTGCKHLSRATFKCLSELKLDGCNMDSKGCKYLSKAPWKQIRMLSLSKNLMNNQTCATVLVANWPKLKELFIDDINLSEKCYQFASKEASRKNPIRLIRASIYNEETTTIARVKALLGTLKSK